MLYWASSGIFALRKHLPGFHYIRMQYCMLIIHGVIIFCPVYSLKVCSCNSQVRILIHSNSSSKIGVTSFCKLPYFLPSIVNCHSHIPFVTQANTNPCATSGIFSSKHLTEESCIAPAMGVCLQKTQK